MACWVRNLNFQRCCRPDPGMQKSPQFSQQLPLANVLVKPTIESAALQHEVDTAADRKGAHEVSRSCWRAGFNFYRCCNRDQAGGNPACWDGRDFTYEKCCHPPGVTRAANLFEDINCDRLSQSWNFLREETTAIASLLNRGELLKRADTALGGLGAWRNSLRRRLSKAEGECPLGRIATEAALLILCLAQQGKWHCSADWCYYWLFK